MTSNKRHNNTPTPFDQNDLKKKLLRWCEKNMELLVMASTTAASVFLFALTFKNFGPRIQMLKNKVVTAMTAPPESLIQLSEAIRKMSSGEVNYMRFQMNKPGSYNSIHMTTANNERFKSYVVPGSETTVFNLASMHVPNFGICPVPIIHQFLTQGFISLLSLGILWRMADQTSDIFSTKYYSSSGRELTFWDKYISNFFSYFFRTADTSPSRKIHKKEVPITFNDVITPAKEELYEIVELLNHPEKFHKIGASCPRGVLLIGPAGTGKTLLARAVAQEANVRFLSCSASSFVEMYVGRGAKRIRALFNEARQSGPCVIFIDELDALGSRGVDAESMDPKHLGFSNAHCEYVQTLNQLLTELDGFMGRNDNVLVIGATNRYKCIDPVLLRAGRFDRWITLHLPTSTERFEILKVSIKRRGLNLTQLAMQLLSSIAQRTANWSGAELDTLINESAFATFRRKQQSHSRAEVFLTTQDDIEEAFQRFVNSRPARRSASVCTQDMQ